MISANFSATSEVDGLTLSCVVVAPEAPVRGVVQFSHGMEEHKERYLPFMDHLASFGFASIIGDHRGHGKSVKDPTDLGYFYDTQGKAVVEDLVVVRAEGLKHLEELVDGLDAQTLPVVLFGHSMGSLVARSFIKRYDHTLSGLVLCGAPFNNPAAKAAVPLIDALSLFGGDRRKSNLMQSIVFGKNNEGLPGTHELRWLSANEDNVEAYAADPLSGFGFTLNGYRNLMKLLVDAFDAEGYQMASPELPILFIGGADDPILGGQKGWESSIAFLRERGYSNIKSKLYEGLRHEILNEKDTTEIFADVVAFLETVCGAEA